MTHKSFFMYIFIGSANVCIHGSEQHNSLSSEIHFLRKQNQLLNVMLVKGSEGKIRRLDAKGAGQNLERAYRLNKDKK